MLLVSQDFRQELECKASASLVSKVESREVSGSAPQSTLSHQQCHPLRASYGAAVFAGGSSLLSIHLSIANAQDHHPNALESKVLMPILLLLRWSQHFHADKPQHAVYFEIFCGTKQIFVHYKVNFCSLESKQPHFTRAEGPH